MKRRCGMESHQIVGFFFFFFRNPSVVGVVAGGVHV